MEARVKIERSKTGLPVIWERGGGMTNTGSSQIVCGANGEKLKPLHVRKGGTLSCSEHALFIVEKDYLVTQAVQHKGDFVIDVIRLNGTFKKSEYGFEIAIGEIIGSFSNSEWNKDFNPEDFQEVIKTVKNKATCYHCREPHYLIEN